ncbi:MAG: hypothetical protein GIKADHBN_01556 [Phycisphaerales bacterium]|nr:hypothetical protein [Phycisphaerales bacterium]MCK6475634.1 prepilin-type N-terminal cleavage/methylation domain-containing protein [Phycisphaerales bacterium]
MNRQTQPTSVRGRRGFTIIEVTATVVVLGILAAAAVPALDAIESARIAAAPVEVERVLLAARARAMATARPTGVTISPGEGEISVVEVAAPGQAPAVVRDVFGQPMQPVDLSARYAGATVTGFVNGDGNHGPGTVWFNHEARPHVRTTGGDFSAYFTQDAVVTMSSGRTVVVRRVTGAVTLP